MQELPDPLLYQVTCHLDLYTQHNLFLCSSQLYKRWHLQVANDDSKWQFIKTCVDLIAVNTGVPGLCTYGSLRFITKQFGSSIFQQDKQARALAATIKFRPSSGESTMMISCAYSNTNWIQMTKGQFWHRLTGLAEVEDAVLKLTLAGESGCERLYALQQQLLKLLCSSNGRLQISVPENSGAAREEQHLTQLQVDCQQPSKRFNHLSQCPSNSWQIDGKSIAAHLVVDRVPKDVAAVHTQVEPYVLLLVS